MTIQWYPGHMAKAKRSIGEQLALIDIIIEVVDARIPQSSRNPDFEDLLSRKPRLITLNKKDLASEKGTASWLTYFRQNDLAAVAINAASKQGIRDLVQAISTLKEPIMLQLEAKGRRRRPVRTMVVGIPNVGKSTVINALIGKGMAKTGDKPGVTKGKQWIRTGADIELLDTPGLLWPKFEDMEIGFRLAATGAISDLVYSVESVALYLLRYLMANSPDVLRERYKLTELSESAEENITLIGKNRGLLMAGGVVKQEQTALMIIQEFRAGKLGRHTLDQLPEFNEEKLP